MSEHTNRSSTATVGRYEKKTRELPFTKKQKRAIERYKMIIALEVAVVVILVALRWFVGGWWITWDTSSLFSGKKPDSTQQTEPPKETVMGEFVAPEFEPNAVVGMPVVDESMGWAVLDITQGYRVHVCGILNADSNGSLPVWFTADADNTVWVKLRIVDENGNVLGETGILKPGEYVERLQLQQGTHSCAVSLEIMGYEPETYHSAGTVSLATTLAVEDGK